MASNSGKGLFVIKLIGVIITAIAVLVGGAYAAFATKDELKGIDIKYEVHCANIERQQERTDDKIGKIEDKIDELPEKIVRLLRQDR